MKPKYSIGQTVKVKATGEKVKIVSTDKMHCGNVYRVYSSNDYKWLMESELKPYRPSRTGKYRNEKGQFISKGILTTKDLLKAMDDCFSVGTKLPDSKQSNYQKILTKLNELEKKIDELGRRV